MNKLIEKAWRFIRRRGPLVAMIIIIGLLLAERLNIASGKKN
jgi:hypothetical protein